VLGNKQKISNLGTSIEDFKEKGGEGRGEILERQASRLGKLYFKGRDRYEGGEDGITRAGGLLGQKKVTKASRGTGVCRIPKRMVKG